MFPVNGASPFVDRGSASRVRLHGFVATVGADSVLVIFSFMGGVPAGNSDKYRQSSGHGLASSEGAPVVPRQRIALTSAYGPRCVAWRFGSALCGINPLYCLRGDRV